MAKQKLNLLEIAARLPTQFRAGPAQCVGAEVLAADLFGRLLDDRPDRPIAQPIFSQTLPFPTGRSSLPLSIEAVVIQNTKR